MNIEQIPLSRIHPYESNAKKHPPAQVEKIARSIKEFGFNQPIVIDKDGIIVVGHGRYYAAQTLKLKAVPCLRVESLSDAQLRAYRLADNKLNESEWDMELVTLELGQLAHVDVNLVDLTGFPRDLVLDPNSPDAGFQLPDGEKDGFVQITFTMTADQAATVQKALTRAKKDLGGEEGDTENRNSNGNAIARIAEEYLGL